MKSDSEWFEEIRTCRHPSSARNRSAAKNGDPILWCSNCGAVKYAGAGWYRSFFAERRDGRKWRG